jgi:exosortase/archaeosortase family protein
VLDILRVKHLKTGTVLQVPDNEFFVDEACSGIVSVMSVLAVGAIWAVWMNRALLHSVLLLAAGVAWAACMNVGRITLIALSHVWWDIDLSEGTPHEILGLVLFTLTFLALIITDRVLAFALARVPVQNVSDERTNLLVRMWNSLVNWRNPVQLADLPRVSANSPPPTSTPFAIGTRSAIVLSTMFLSLGVLQTVSWFRGYQDSMEPVTVALQVHQGLLPAEVKGWKLVKFDVAERESMNEFGQYSRIYTYEHAASGAQATISFDFLFRGGWHELSVCYRNFGWPMESREVDDFPLIDGSENWKVIQANYRKPTGEFGYLAFIGMNGSGECLQTLLRGLALG